MTDTQKAMIQILEKAIKDIQKDGYTFTHLGKAVLFANANHAYIEIEVAEGVITKATFSPIYEAK